MFCDADTDTHVTEQVVGEAGAPAEPPAAAAAVATAATRERPPSSMMTEAVIAQRQRLEGLLPEGSLLHDLLVSAEPAL
jgi:hypothetical protein